MLCKKRLLKVTRNPTVRKRRQRTCQIDQTGSGVGFKCGSHDLLTWLVPYAASMHRRFAVGRDGKGCDYATCNISLTSHFPFLNSGQFIWTTLNWLSCFRVNSQDLRNFPSGSLGGWVGFTSWCAPCLHMVNL